MSLKEIFEDRANFDTAGFQTWLAERPQVIQDLARRWPPNVVYRLKTTGQIVVLQAYSENGTVRVYVIPECAGPITGGTSVFGIDPADLELVSDEQIEAQQRRFAECKAVLGELDELIFTAFGRN